MNFGEMPQQSAQEPNDEVSEAEKGPKVVELTTKAGEFEIPTRVLLDEEGNFVEFMRALEVDDIPDIMGKSILGRLGVLGKERVGLEIDYDEAGRDESGFYDGYFRISKRELNKAVKDGRLLVSVDDNGVVLFDAPQGE